MANIKDTTVFDQTTLPRKQHQNRRKQRS